MHALTPIKEPKFRVFGPTRLYLDDVEVLFAAFSKSLMYVRIQADGYEMEDPAELPKIGRVIKSFTILGTAPFVAVNVKPYLVNAYCEDGRDVVGAGLLAQADDVLQRRRAPLAWLRSWRITVLSLVNTGALVAVAFGLPKSLLATVLSDLLLWTTILIVVATVWSFLRETRRRGRVYTSRSGDRIGWLERNSNVLIVGVVTAIIGTVVGGLIVAYATGVWKV